VKVLLDENLAHRLRKNLGAHEVFTVSYKGWAGLKNGELLRTAENDGIEVFLTGDQTLTYEQNLTGRTIAIVALSSVEWAILKHHLPLILAAINSALPGSFQAVGPPEYIGQVCSARRSVFTSTLNNSATAPRLSLPEAISSRA
jgi:hypothetical protein